jgi:hypothetical protein
MATLIVLGHEGAAFIESAGQPDFPIVPVLASGDPSALAGLRSARPVKVRVRPNRSLPG